MLWIKFNSRSTSRCSLSKNALLLKNSASKMKLMLVVKLCFKNSKSKLKPLTNKSRKPNSQWVRLRHPKKNCLLFKRLVMLWHCLLCNLYLLSVVPSSLFRRLRSQYSKSLKIKVRLWRKDKPVCVPVQLISKTRRTKKSRNLS